MPDPCRDPYGLAPWARARAVVMPYRVGQLRVNLAQGGWRAGQGPLAGRALTVGLEKEDGTSPGLLHSF